MYVLTGLIVILGVMAGLMMLARLLTKLTGKQTGFIEACVVFAVALVALVVIYSTCYYVGSAVCNFMAGNPPIQRLK
jgi:hypothetical protein